MCMIVFDNQGAAEFLGRSKAPPMVKLDPGDARTPVLQWFPIIRDNDEAGEMLAAFELLKVNISQKRLNTLLPLCFQ